MKNRRLKKTLSAMLTAAMLLQTGFGSAAQETDLGTEAAALAEQSEAESEAARKAAEQSEAESEAARKAAEQSEAESEAARKATEQSEAESEAARKAAEQSEAESEAARKAAEQSEAESEAARKATEQSEAESEAARKAAESETAKESETQAPTTEKETDPEKETEKKNKKKKKKKETSSERSDYKNSGEKMSAKDAASGLKYASLYLFAAEQITAPEDLFEEAQVVTGKEAETILTGLNDFSLELADAKSSDDLEIINLYVDQDGKLDETQLEELDETKTIDVSDKYYVVNVIADSAEQKLDFSGYDMLLSDASVKYESGEQPCDIIYNFAAWDDGEFTGYKGSLTLTNGAGLQGIYLAPEAEVTVNSDLAGAVYAEQITIEESVEHILELTFAQSTETATETASEAITETATETASEAITETATETASEAITETATETASEAITEATTEAASEAVTETASEAAAEAVSEFVTETAGETTEEQVTDAGEITIETEPQEMLTEAASTDAETILPDEEELLIEGMVTTWTSGMGQDPVMPAIAADPALAPVLTVTAEDGTTALTGAVFVIRDAQGKLVALKNENGEPQYEVKYTGTPFTIEGLAEGSYVLSQTGASEGIYQENGIVTEGAYQIAEDLAFQVSAAAGAAALTVVNKAVPDNGKKLTVSAQAYYSTVTGQSDPKTNVLLTAEEDVSYYVALYEKTESGIKRISDVQRLMIAAETAQQTATPSVPESELSAQAETEAVQVKVTDAVFDGLAEGTYYLAAADAFGNLLDPEQLSYRLQETDAAAKMTMTPVVIGAQDTEKAAVLQYVYQNGQYPELQFSYMADISLSIDVLGKDGKPLAVNETFYAAIYSDESLTTARTEKPIEWTLSQTSSAVTSYQMKMTVAEQIYYLAEVTADGTLITPESDFAYAVTYPKNETGAFTVSCGSPVQVEVQNKQNDSIVKIGVKNKDGAYLSGAVLAIKNSSGRVIAVNNAKTFESAEQMIEWKNLLEDGKKYYISEIQAPEGYAPSPDVSFTVKAGKTTEAVIQNAAAAVTDYQLTVNKQVYAETHQLYAYDSTNKTYAKAGAYTFYAALFSDAKHTKKVSDVQKITVSGFGGNTVFKNLESGKTYYLAETTQYGEVYKSSTTTRTIKYTDAGKITMEKANQSAIIQNVYKKLPGGYRYTGTLTLKTQVLDTAGNPLAVNSTFYAGIYRTADYSDKPTTVKLELKNVSSASVKRRILLSGENDMVYYIAELDANGNRITESSDFAYTVSVDKPEVTVGKSTEQVVTLTNKVKSSKATLYLTKKVYDGTNPKKVNETFYAGLFKDAEFKELYTKPIALKLEDKSELTLKLTLNLGTSAKTTIYVAEVDKDGKVIRNQRDFGYEVKVVNSVASFTQEKLEIQSILVNTVYGSASSDQWDHIYDDAISSGHYSGSYDDYDNGYYGGGFSSNGAAFGDGSGVATGDDTPILYYILLLGASFLLFGGLLFGKRRIAKKNLK